jgi:uncharacterized protein (TIRG00374 family)
MRPPALRVPPQQGASGFLDARATICRCARSAHPPGKLSLPHGTAPGGASHWDTPALAWHRLKLLACGATLGPCLSIEIIPVGKLKALLSVLLLATLVMAAVTHLDARMLAQLFALLSGPELAILAVLPLGFILTRALRFTILLAPTEPGQAATAVYGYVASQAVSSFPTGLAGRAAVLKNSGLPLRRNVVPLMTDSFFDLSFLAVATLIVASLRPVYRAPLYLAVPLLICLAPVLMQLPGLRKGVKRLTFRAARRWNKVDLWKNLRRSALRLANSRRLLAGIGLTLLANAVSLFALWYAVHAFSLSVPLLNLVVAVTVPALLGRLIFLPGSGSGVVAAGMATILAQTGGLTANEGAAVSILYRGIDMVMPTIYGWLVLLLVRSPSKRTRPALSSHASETGLGSRA